MCALNSYRYVETMYNNNGVGAYPYEIIQIYSVLFSTFIHCVKFDYLQQRRGYGRFTMTT